MSYNNPCVGRICPQTHWLDSPLVILYHRAPYCASIAVVSFYNLHLILTNTNLTLAVAPLASFVEYQITCFVVTTPWL